MRGLDTNVLVRYLTWDDPDQAERAAGVIESAVGEGERLFIGPLVICELVWVLEGAYGLDRDEVLDTVEAVLRTAQFNLGDKDVLWLALGDARRGPAGFADYVIARRAKAAGSDHTVTFDRGLADSSLFEVI